MNRWQQLATALILMAGILALPVRAQDQNLGNPNTDNINNTGAISMDNGINWWWIIVPLIAIPLLWALLRKPTDRPKINTPYMGAEGGRADDIEANKDDAYTGRNQRPE